MDKIFKEVNAKIKALPDESTDTIGVIEAYASTWDCDSVGDKVVPGAFAKTLQNWNDSGRKIPLLWSHDFRDPFSFIGSVDEAKETADGLYIKAHFDLDGNNPTADQVYRLTKGGRINQLSFQYQVKDSEYVGDTKEADDGTQVLLKELDLFEVTLCHLGANQATRVLAIKSDDETVETKAGRTLSSANQAKIQSALQSIQDALETLEAVTGVADSDDAASSNDDGKAQDDQQVKDEEPEAKAEAEEPEAKSEDSVRYVPASLLSAELDLLALDV